jgi:hypothetical protein
VKIMKKLGLATALVLTLAFGAGSVFAQNSNTSGGGTNTGGTMKAKHSRRHHRRAMRRRHHRRAMKAANANSNT